jgi:hypothetical protein
MHSWYGSTKQLYCDDCISETHVEHIHSKSGLDYSQVKRAVVDFAMWQRDDDLESRLSLQKVTVALWPKKDILSNDSSNRRDMSILI